MREETQILIKALKLMENGHWSGHTLYEKEHKGQDGQYVEKYCATGAISEVAEGAVRNVGDGNTAADKAAKILASVIHVPGGRRQMGVSTESDAAEIIPMWNDSDGRKFRAIKAGFCRAIKKSMELYPEPKPKRRRVRKPVKKVRKRAA